MPKNCDHHEVLLVAGTLYRLEKRTGWPYASCPLPWPCEQKKERKKEKRKEMRRTLMEKSVGGGVFVSWRGGEIEITHGVAVPCRAAAIGIHERHGLLDHTNIMTLREPEEMTAGSLARHSLDSIMG